MMDDDTPQPETAGETDTVADAAEAFKVALGQAEPRPRDDKGRFASAAPEGEADEPEEINADEGEEPEPAASDEEQEEGEDAPDEGQQSAVEMPSSWSKEDAEVWSELPPEAQARIAEREGQRDTAVNQKFQEAANLRKAHEAEIIEAQTTRQRHAEAIDHVLSLVQPQWPSDTMLDANSSDYDPDEYHLQRAKAERTQGILSQLASQRQQLAAQEEQAAQREVQTRAEDINRTTGPAFIKAFPDAADPGKAEGFFKGLVDYALKEGAPPDFFQSGPVTAIEWHIMAKAKAYDELQAARAKVRQEPKPEPRKPQPVLRPGVTTPRSAAEASKRKANFDRLARDGTVEAGAAVFKDLLRSQ